MCRVCGCSACVTLRTTLPSTRRQSPFDKSQLRYLCISLITRRSLYRFRTIRTAKAAVLAMKSAAYVQFLSNLCICERSTVYLHPSESIESTLFDSVELFHTQATDMSRVCERAGSSGRKPSRSYAGQTTTARECCLLFCPGTFGTTHSAARSETRRMVRYGNVTWARLKRLLRCDCAHQQGLNRTGPFVRAEASKRD